MANRILIFVFTIAIAVVLTGCSDPYSQERLRRREANREQFFRRAAESESRRPAKLQKTFNMLVISLWTLPFDGLRPGNHWITTLVAVSPGVPLIVVWSGYRIAREPIVIREKGQCHDG